MADTNIRITGVAKTVKALREIEPEVAKRMNTTIRKALSVTSAGAKQRYPKGAWSVNINTKKILGSISARSGLRLDNDWGNSAPGVKAAIFEFAGSRQPGRTPQARGLIKSLTERYGQPGRFLWDSWDDTGKEALNTIEQAIRSAERELQMKLDAAGETY